MADGARCTPCRRRRTGLLNSASGGLAFVCAAAGFPPIKSDKLLLALVGRRAVFGLRHAGKGTLREVERERERERTRCAIIVSGVGKLVLSRSFGTIVSAKVSLFFSFV